MRKWHYIEPRIKPALAMPSGDYSFNESNINRL